MFKKVFFVIVWFVVIPAAVSRAAAVVTRERITDQPRAYVEARWPGSLLDYLIHCPVCVSHWVCLGFLAACSGAWWKILTGISGSRVAAVALLAGLWPATTEVALKGWKPQE